MTTRYTVIPFSKTSFDGVEKQAIDKAMFNEIVTMVKNKYGDNVTVTLEQDTRNGDVIEADFSKFTNLEDLYFWKVAVEGIPDDVE